MLALVRPIWYVVIIDTPHTFPGLPDHFRIRNQEDESLGNEE
jgi:hypothetical protein